MNQPERDTPTLLALTIVQGIKDDQPMALVVGLRDLLKRHYPKEFALFKAVADQADAVRNGTP